MYDYFADPEQAQALAMFTRFHLLDMTLAADKTLAGHGSAAWMEKQMKYSQDRALFKVLSQEQAIVRDWQLGVGMREHPIGLDYWETV